ncbi:MAG: NAD(P)/FAD-dependent oxidoreductase [Bacteroidia bacterium]
MGGGAAGFFAAIHAAEKFPKAEIWIIEGSNKVLSKVLISGGGRCNVTNQIWQPAELAKNYPRGHIELVEPFQRFNSKHTVEWFERRGAKLKIEPDGRVFPVSNDSKTIADILVNEARRLGVKVLINQRVVDVKMHKNKWVVHTNTNAFESHSLAITTGSNLQMWNVLEKLGLQMVRPVPSLFSFHSSSQILRDLAGISLESVEVSLPKLGIKQQGAILITHEGLSGPAILKLSAWAARELAEAQYHFQLKINWLADFSEQDFALAIRQEQQLNPKKFVQKNPVLNIPKRFWQRLCELAEINEFRNYAEIGKKQVAKISELIFSAKVEIVGKSTNKDEFVTAGGVDLSEIDFTNFSSKKYPNLYLAGEVLNIDAITGGFNFQGAWTGGALMF